MTATGFALFPTTIGTCGISWNERGVVGVQLPESRPAATRARIHRLCPGAEETIAPPEVQATIEGIVSLLRGERTDLSHVALDLDGVPPFHRRVYDVARSIPPGSTLSYGEIAARLGSPGSARAVGQALGRNPVAIVVPCHRVLAAGGRVGGFSANGGITTKLRLLAIEGRAASDAPTLFDGDGTLGFDPVTAVEWLRATDDGLARLIDAVGPIDLRLDRTPSTFAGLAEAIVYQQLTATAAATIYARVCALFPRGHEGPTAEQVLRVSDERLRAAGLSRSKLLSLRDLAQRVVDGEVPTLAEIHGMDDDAIIERLTTVRGIGRWTAQMFLIFRLGRPDVLPADDLGIRKGFALTFDTGALPPPEAVTAWGQRWQPYRTAASWYLWRALDQRREGAAPGSAPPPALEALAPADMEHTPRTKRVRAR